VSARYRVVIPARYASVRLPGKPLLALRGRPMIQWTHERACRSGAEQVIVATDDVRIAQVAAAFKATVRMTAATHACGSDRIAEVARAERWGDEEIVVNLQADEPLMPELLLDQVAALLATHDSAEIATLAAPLESIEALLDPNVVKVVSDAEQRVLYFSRAPIPWVRDGAESGLTSQRSHALARRHLGLYAYRVGALKRLAALPPSPLEQLEKLEQLRALEAGMQIRLADALTTPGPDLNTEADRARVEAALAHFTR
jgi:3-deoxy-manno-octulosonate cytidylyltransferase (CMP-KDO synthetase)